MLASDKQAMLLSVFMRVSTCLTFFVCSLNVSEGAVGRGVLPGESNLVIGMNTL